MQRIFYGTLIFFSLCSTITKSAEVLSAPGLYMFGSDVVCDPATDGEFAVNITSSNVILDLDNHSVSQLDTNTHIGTIGILVDPDLSDVTIRTGLVRLLPDGIGIKVGSGCSRISIENIEVNFVGGRGISFEGTAESPINNPSVVDSQIASCGSDATGDYGIYFEHCNNGIVDNVTVVGSGSIANDFEAFHLSNCTNFELSDCDVRNSEGSAFAGIRLINSLNNIIERTRAISNASDTGDCVLFDVQTGSNGNSFLECIAQSNITTSTRELSSFSIAGATSCTLFNCSARSNTATNTESTVYGIKVVDSTTMLIDGCSISNNQQTALGNTYGILWNNTNRSVVTNSVVDSNSADVECYGMLCDTCSDCQLRGNHFLYNTGSSLSRGLKLINSPNHVAIQNVAFSNGSTGTEQIEGLTTLETADLDTTVANLAAITYPWINIRAFN